MDNVQDPQQFQQFRTGSMEAFAGFYARYHQSLYRYARKLCQEPDLALDLTALAFTSLWEHREQMPDGADLRNYLFSMVHLHFQQHLRKADEGGREPAFCRQQTAFESGEFIETVFAAMEEGIQKLGPRQRLVMELLYFKEVDVKGIARLLDISPQTVRNQISFSNYGRQG
jgi:RNA polymerase sigma factor (sigma-70 family)